MPRIYPYFAVFLFAITLFACSEKQNSPSIGLSIANPMDITTSQDGRYFLLLNANSSVKSPGSILVLDGDKKVYAKDIARLGRRIDTLGSAILVTADRESDSGAKGQVLLYEWSEPNGGVNIAPIKSWSYDEATCAPYHVVTSKDPSYPLFAVSCTNGNLLVGKLNMGALAQSSLQVVRKYPSQLRNAMYIDAKRHLLFAFPTQVGEPSVFDASLPDKEIWNAATQGPVTGEDDIPDAFQQSTRTMRNLQLYGSPYQFVMLDLDIVENAGFSLQTVTTNPALIASELRWVYFNLENEGTPDVHLSKGNKYYHTNFVEARPGFDGDSFYLSHSGTGAVNQSENANNLIEVRLIGNPKATLTNGVYTIPLTRNYLSFTRKYGFQGVQTKSDSYLQGFSLFTLEGQRMAAVNSFRDIVLFNSPSYSITVASLEKETWFAPQTSDSFSHSLFRSAYSPVTQQLAVLSYHSSSVLLLQPNLGQALQTVAEIH